MTKSPSPINGAAPRPLAVRYPTEEQIEGFAERFGFWMKARGLSQSSLGAATGIPQPAISTWVNGHAVPSVPVVAVLEDALDLTPGELSRQLGYLPLDAFEVASVPDAIESDPALSVVARKALLALYAHFVGEQ